MDNLLFVLISALVSLVQGQNKQPVHLPARILLPAQPLQEYIGDRREQDETHCLRACFRLFRPVCGSDGATYGNECFFAIGQCVAAYEGVYIFIKHVGNCATGVTPTSTYTQVTGSSKSANEQGSLMCPDDCPATYMPLCASDGNTYRNFCHFVRTQCLVRFQFKDLRILRKGACESRCTLECSSDDVPICGSDGITYTNMCEFVKTTRCDSVSSDIIIEYDGPCMAHDIEVETLSNIAEEEDIVDEIMCLKACRAIFQPLCASNGVTYDNVCDFEIALCEAKRHGEALTMFSEGECPTIRAEEESTEEDNASTEAENADTKANDEVKCNKICTRQFQPVCGTDGKTYSNPCVFESFVCEAGKQGRVLRMASKGSCESIDDDTEDADDAPNAASQDDPSITAETVLGCLKACSKLYNPVCASNNRTYGNRCMYQVAKCVAERKGHQLKFVANGKCENLV